LSTRSSGASPRRARRGGGPGRGVPGHHRPYPARHLDRRRGGAANQVPDPHRDRADGVSRRGHLEARRQGGKWDAQNRTVSCLYLPAPRPTSWRPSPSKRDPGPGPKTEERLRAMGLRTVGALAAYENPASGPGAGHQRRGAAASRPRPRTASRSTGAGLPRRSPPRPRSTRTSATAASWRMRCAISPTGSQRG